MDVVASDAARLLVREVESFKSEIALFPDDELPWTTVDGVTNSAANLALHVAGNLQHFVGGILGRTGYVRNRELEFNQRSGSRASIGRELDAAIAVVQQVVPRLTPEQLAATFPDPSFRHPIRTGLFLMHLCVHASFHLGQAGYLRRMLTGSNQTTNPVSTRLLAE